MPPAVMPPPQLSEAAPRPDECRGMVPCDAAPAADAAPPALTRRIHCAAGFTDASLTLLLNLDVALIRWYGTFGASVRFDRVVVLGQASLPGVIVGRAVPAPRLVESTRWRFFVTRRLRWCPRLLGRARSSRRSAPPSRPRVACSCHLRPPGQDQSAARSPGRGDHSMLLHFFRAVDASPALVAGAQRLSS